ncbi:MAG: hypothetical protein V5A88_01550 [Candidatus Thermoplasmatota archaeon]
MRAVLYSEIIRRKVDTPVEKGKAKLVEVLALSKESSWVAGEVSIESGLVNKRGRFFPVSAVEYDRDKKTIKLSQAHGQGRKYPLDKHEFYLSRLDGKKVETHDGDEVGRIYDFEIYTHLVPWKVWKMMVDPSGLSPLKRRVRIPTKKVNEVKDKKVVLKEGWK